MNKLPKILVLDIETSPIVSYHWGLFDQNISLSQVKEDWSVISFAAKWVGEKEIFYADQRGVKNVRDDKKLLAKIWKLMDEADIILGQNSNSFDIKKLNARFIKQGFKPPSSYRKLDTLRIAKKNFGFTSFKLEYMSEFLNKKFKKLKNSGFNLWIRCLAGELKAWQELETYNKFDVLATEELYNMIKSWDNTINFNVYHDDFHNACNCGSTDFKRNGFFYSNAGKYQRHKCLKCGRESRDKKNMLIKEKRESLKA